MKERRLVTFAAWGLIALGCILRVREYLANRSLWLDEAMLALNIIEKNVAGLFGKLDYNQGAPLGFLLLEKLAAALLGSGERALRLLPLLAGCASLVLLYFLARKILTPPGLLTTLAILTFGRHVIYYSGEVKQYSTDVFFALALGLLGTRIFHREPSGRDYWLLALGGALALWFSHPALFVLAALGGVLLLQNWKNRPARLKTLALGGVWLLSFGLLYFVNLRALSQNQFLFDYWADFFMPHSWQAPQWSLDILRGALYNPGGLTSFVPTDGNFIDTLLLSIPFILFLVGLYALLRRDWRFGALFGLTLLAALAASALGEYPFGGRMVLFAVPIFALLIGAGLDWIASLFAKRPWLANGIALLLAVFLIYTPVESAVRIFITPRYPEHIRPAVSYLEANLKPGDKVYIYNWALPAFRYYANPSLDYVAGGLHTGDPQALLAELNQFKGQSRVWILFSHVYEQGAYNEKELMLDHLNQLGQKKRQFIEPGSSVYLYLYDLR